MIFIHIARVVAWAALVLGVVGIAMGLAAAFGLTEASATRSWGKQVYDGLTTAFYGLVLGLLAEIATRLGDRQNA